MDFLDHRAGAFPHRVWLQPLDQTSGHPLQPFNGIAKTAPCIARGREQSFMPRAVIRITHRTIERVKPHLQIRCQSTDNRRISALALPAWHTNQGRNQIPLQPPFRRGAEDMQTIANLTFFQVTKVIIQTRKLALLVTLPIDPRILVNSRGLT